METIRDTKSNTQIDGKNLDTISAERAAYTMKKEYYLPSGEITTVYKENGKKLRDYLNEEIVLIDGSKTTNAKLKARKKGDNMIKNGSYYRVLKAHDPNYEQVLPAIEVRKLSPGLEKKTKENFLGKSKFGQTLLTKKNKSHLIGLYVEKLPLNPQANIPALNQNQDQ